ncbi:TPA: GNAT family N-acetyltransferase [Klebsiella pneumoniae]|nr:GNAT family N-acetyltransferase [Klebsiella pneumoniae]
MLVQTNRLYLRPVISSDLNDLFKIYGDPATNTFNPAGPYPNIDHAKMVMNRWLDHWQTHSFGNWAISPLTNPEKIIGFGGLGIRNYDDIVINNLGYRLSTEAWGKGLATEFAIYAIKFGFDVIKLTEISAVVRENHLASQKVLHYRKSAERDGQTRRDRCSDKDLLSVAQLTQYRVSFPQGHFSVY